MRRFLPRSLLGRGLLMILLPLVLLQAVAFTFFYGGHLDLVSRRLSGAIAGEVAMTVDLLSRYPEDRAAILARAYSALEVPMRVLPGAQLPADMHRNVLGPMDEDLASALRDKVRRPYVMDWTTDARAVLVRIALTDGVLEVEAPRKRLYTSTFTIFVVWVVGTALLVFAIAALFLRNQVRPITRLARAAENFGKGRDTGPIKPEGAIEVRQAAAAFNLMQARIRRFLAQRTEMLAGVSHDLRTPLTRLRLALAMLPSGPELREDVAGMSADLAEMERMIGGYLAFARGEGNEPTEPVDLGAMLDDVASSARRAGGAVRARLPGGLTLRLRPDAARRALTNLVDNARRHGSQVELSAVQEERSVHVLVDDDGPGIPAGRREAVFRPFESGSSGGTGLGLTIARDIVRGHGGEISLEDSPLGGLRARIRLPL